MTAALLVAAVLAVTLLAWTRRPKRLSPHQQALRDVLDSADALEDRLRTARAEIEAVVGEADSISLAMKEMLRQRLWLRDHSASATPAQLDEVRRAIDEARRRIEQQLVRIEAARLPGE